MQDYTTLIPMYTDELMSGLMMGQQGLVDDVRRDWGNTKDLDLGSQRLYSPE